jgi:hypothetical protein
MTERTFPSIRHAHLDFCIAVLSCSYDARTTFTGSLRDGCHNEEVMNQGHLELACNSDFWLSQIFHQIHDLPVRVVTPRLSLEQKNFAGNDEQQLIRVAPAELRMR